MELYLLRHGDAEPRGGNVKEARRALTGKGERDVRSVVARAHLTRRPPTVLLTSPYKRARQTVEIAAEALRELGVKHLRIEETRHLLPDSRPEALWKQLAGMQEPAILLAGHEPNMGNLARFLLMQDVAIDFKKGAMMRISTSAPPAAPNGVFKWLLTPRLARD